MVNFFIYTLLEALLNILEFIYNYFVETFRLLIIKVTDSTYE